MPGPTCQSHAPLKRHPVAGLMHVRQLLDHAPVGRATPWWPRAPPRASLSPACLGFEAKLDFFTSPLPSPLHRSHHVLSALPTAICLYSKHRSLPSRLRPPTRSFDAAPTTARVPTTFPSHEPPTPTTGRRPPPPFPASRVVPLWTPPSGEPLPSPMTKSSPPHRRPSLRPTTPSHRAAAHRNRRCCRAPRSSPTSASGREALWAWSGRPLPSGIGPFQQFHFMFFIQN
jgi:hypothetical protein